MFSEPRLSNNLSYSRKTSNDNFSTPFVETSKVYDCPLARQSAERHRLLSRHSCQTRQDVQS